MNEFINTIKNIKYLFFIAVASVFFSMCQEPEETDVEDIELQISTYLVEHEDQYSEFLQAIKTANFYHLLKTRGPYTLFVPTNEAMNNYYTKIGVKSLEEIPDDEITDLVKNHIVSLKITTYQMSLGSLTEPNALNDRVATNFSDADIYINNESKIIEKNIEVNNGVIHVVDKVVEIIDKNIYEVIKENGNFSIFTEGLEKTGIKDTLELISIPYGKIEARTRFTIMAVADSVFNREGIMSYTDLEARYDDGNGAITSVDNGLYKYIDYHVLEGDKYCSDISSGVYYTASRENQMNIKISGIDYIINQESKIHVFASNIPAKNGVIHQVDNLLPDIEPITDIYYFGFTRFPDLMNRDCYMKEIRNFFDGENEFAKIKWNADYFQYYYKTTNIYAITSDGITMSEGHWWLEITVPKIRRGKYAVKIHAITWGNRANLYVFIDGVKMKNRLEFGINDRVEDDFVIVDEIEWTKTEEHVFRFQTYTPGILYSNMLIFEPVE